MNKTFIIAEAGVNHNGDIKLAYKLVDAAKAAGVDCIKFQTFKTKNIVLKDTSMAEYQEKNLNKKESQYKMIEKLELSYKDFEKINEYCKQKKIMFLSSSADKESLDFLVEKLKMNTIKISSGEITNYVYLEEIGKKNKEIILSTGMSNLGEVEKAVNILRKYTKSKITLLHCTTNYPCPMEEVNLKAMLTLKSAFKLDVGYSDHTLGIEVPISAVAMGAKIIEKHFTLDKTMDGPDHKASLNPKELKQMVISIRNIEQALGDGIKKPNLSEEKLKGIVRKKIILKKKHEKGDTIKKENLDFKRSNKGIESNMYELVIGKKINKNLKKNTPLNWEDLC